MRIGVDLGGTKIEVMALADDGRELLRERRATPRNDYAGTVETIAGLVVEVEARLREPGSVGISHPGAISPATGLVKNANSTWLNGRALGRDLPERLGRPIKFANDANCFALSEASDGAARGAAVVFGVIIGTGVGGGIVVDAKVLGGRNAIAGEWGHNPLPWPRDDEWPGHPCYCGLTGCIETFLSGSGLARDYARRSNSEATAQEIAARADAGDAVAAASIDVYAERLARALASVINVLDPDVIVLGGGLSNIGRLYERIPALWSSFVFSDTVTTTLVSPVHGDSSGVRGAARLWDAERRERRFV
jgi:fructokinase